MEPVRTLDKNLWVIDHPLRMPGGIEIGTRTTLVRLASGELWMHSPGPFSSEALDWIRYAGELGHPDRDAVRRLIDGLKVRFRSGGRSGPR